MDKVKGYPISNAQTSIPSARPHKSASLRIDGLNVGDNLQDLDVVPRFARSLQDGDKHIFPVVLSIFDRLGDLFVDVGPVGAQFEVDFLEVLQDLDVVPR